MEDLDAKIDVLERERIFYLIAENSVRYKNINIRQTRNNNKNSIEHLDELVASYEKLLRLMPREFYKIEQTIRVKFLEPLNEKRKIKILSSIHQEMELILDQMMTKFLGLYKMRGQDEKFSTQMEKNRSRCMENAEKLMDKLVLNLQKHFQSSTLISLPQLEKKYGMDQESLNQLHLVKVLQDINTIFYTLKNNGVDEKILNTVHDAIVDRVNIGKMLEKMLPPQHKVAARKEWRMRVAKESVKLKQMIVSIHNLAGHIETPKEQRNYDVSKKNWSRIEETFEEIPDEYVDSVLAKLKPFYNLLESQN